MKRRSLFSSRLTMKGSPDQNMARASKKEECGAATRTGATDLETRVPVMLTENPQHRQQTRPKKQETCWRCFLQPLTGTLRSQSYSPSMETVQARMSDMRATRILRGTRVT